MSETKELLAEIYAAIDRAEVLSALEPRDRGSYYELTCPACGEREAFVYKNGTRIICNRLDKCAFKQSLWDYVQKAEGLSQRETLQELARLANYALPELDPEVVERMTLLRAQADAWETTVEFLQAGLWEEKGRAVLDYLHGRGFADDEIQRMELGLFMPPAAVALHMKAKTIDAAVQAPIIEALGSIGSGHELVIPFRDPVGRVRGLVVRTIGTAEPKYQCSLGLKRDVVFNLDRARGCGTAVVVEGYLDALAVREKAKFEKVVGLGDTSLSETKLESLLKYGAKSFVLALDNDTSGMNGTERALALLRKQGLRAYVLVFPSGIKDADELIRKKGPAAFTELVATPRSAARWMAGRILARHDVATDIGRDAALDDALAYEDSLVDPIDTQDFMDPVVQVLGLSLDQLDHRIKVYKETLIQTRIIKASQAILEDGLGRLRAGTAISPAELEGQFRDLRLKTERTMARPAESLVDHLKEKQEREATRDAPLLGYDLKTFGSIARDSDGIQPGLYIIGAYTAKGKTALATNLFIDLLLSNPGLTGLYFSLDDNRDVIINRFLAILSGIKLNQIQRRLKDPGEREELDRSYARLSELASGGWLNIRDISEISHVDRLEDEVREHAMKKLVVVIDGLYNMDVGSDLGGIRELNIERANRIKVLVDTYKLPVICTAELRKKLGPDKKTQEPTIDDLMETSKFAYNANLVWLLYPKDKKEYDEEPSPTIILKFEKNKLSYFMGKQELAFTKATGTLSEPGKVTFGGGMLDRQDPWK